LINLEKNGRYWYNWPRKIEKELERRNRLWHGNAMCVAKGPLPGTASVIQIRKQEELGSLIYSQ